MTEEAVDAKDRLDRAKARRKLSLLSAALLGAGMSVAALLLFFAVRNRDPSPIVTGASLAKAEQRWRMSGPSNYDMEIEVQARGRDVYRVSVRQGSAVSLHHNGNLMTRQHAWDTWSVPGMFDTIRRDLKTVESGEATGYAQQLRLKCDFNEKYGYPERYRRTQKSGAREVIWNVVSFKVVSGAGDDSS